MITYSLRSVEAATFNARSEDLRSAPVKTLHTCIPHTNLYSLAPKIVRTNLRRSYYSQHPSRTAPVCLDGDKLRAVVLMINSVTKHRRKVKCTQSPAIYLRSRPSIGPGVGRFPGQMFWVRGGGRDIPYLYPPYSLGCGTTSGGPVCCLLSRFG